MAISQRSIEFDSAAGTRGHAYMAVPDTGSGPGLLLLHDGHGVDDHVKHLANLHAEEGWVVMAPPFTAEDGAATDDTARALAALRAAPMVDGACGVLGHGQGARLALKLAAYDGELACAVAYEPTLTGDDGAWLAAIACATLIHATAKQDAGGEALLARLAEHPLVDVLRYDAAPGFDNANGAHYSRSAHWLAKSRTLALLRRHLGPVHDLAALWEAHLYSEFADRNVDVSMATMVDEPYVLVVPTVTGGTGKQDLHRWYSHHFHFQNPEDTTIIPISRTIGADRLVDEFIFCFTHDRVMDWILPGIAPTGKYVEVPMTAVVNFRGAKLYHEHIAWDQATVLVQTGLLDPSGLPVTGIEQSKAMQDETLPRNRLIPGW